MAADYIMKTGAKVINVAQFTFQRGDTTTKTVSINVGTKVKTIFASDDNSYIILVANVTKIEPGDTNDSDFVLEFDITKTNSEDVYRVCSGEILDIEKATDDMVTGAFTVANATTTTISPSKVQLATTTSDNSSSYFSWDSNAIRLVRDKARGYNVVQVVYAKKKPVNMMLVVCDLQGNIIYKALDTTQRVSMKSTFTWTLRNYITTINTLPATKKLKNYTLDSEGNFVMTDDVLEDSCVKQVEKTDTNISTIPRFIVELVYADSISDLLTFDPITYNRKKYAVEAKRVSVTQEDILSAAYNIYTDPEGAVEAIFITKDLEEDDTTAITIDGVTYGLANVYRNGDLDTEDIPEGGSVFTLID
jgi:hypothetical protein